MSDHLAPSVYTIESIHRPGQYVSVGYDNPDAVLGYKMDFARIQRWALEYDEEGFATFQGVSPTREAKGWIAVNEDGTGLVYTLAGPSKFKLHGAEGFHFVNTPKHPTHGWELKSGEDGTPVTIGMLIGFQGNWKFTECRE